MVTIIINDDDDDGAYDGDHGDDGDDGDDGDLGGLAGPVGVDPPLEGVADVAGLENSIILINVMPFVIAMMMMMTLTLTRIGLE